MIPIPASLKSARAWVALGSVALILGSGWLLVAAAPPGAPLRSGTTKLLAAAEGGLPDDVSDTDGDGLVDALEAYVYGSDPNNPDSSGLGVPDGWLVDHGYEPLDPDLHQERAAEPDPASLPAAFNGTWPASFRIGLAQAYRHGRPADWEEPRDGPWRGGLDPRRADQDADGVPDGYLLAHGLDPLASSASTTIPGDSLSLRQKFEAALDPTTPDTDADGLDDAREIHVARTDPRRYSTAGSGVADGWLVQWGLDARDPRVARQLAPSGLTIEETFLFSLSKLGMAVLRERAGLDPTAISTRGGPVPDGWLVRNGLDPLGSDTESRVLQRASDEPRLASRDAVLAQRPADVQLTVRDAYEYGRPPGWDESRDGVWWGGLDPGSNDTDGDGVADAVEIRGWPVTVRLAVGTSVQPAHYVAASDPRERDTDGDGLLDGMEFLGGLRFPATDASRVDTDFDGLGDADEVLGPRSTRGRLNLSAPGDVRLDPTRADSAGALVADGAAFLSWESRCARYGAAGATQAYEFPHSGYATVVEAARALGAHVSSLSPAGIVSLFCPEGDADDDGLPNLLDADADDDGLPTGAELDPLRLPSILAEDAFFSSSLRRPATDPANPDTDADTLLDGWEARHAAPNAESDAWLLDPTRLASLADGVADHQRDPDADSIAWVARGPLGTIRNEFRHDHGSEQQADTLPFQADSNDDDVPDGFGVFWSSTYPDLLASSDPRVGTLVPDPTLVESQRLRLRASNDLGNVFLLPADSIAYARVVDVTPFAAAGVDEDVFQAAAGLLRPHLGEAFVRLFRDVTVVEPEDRQPGRAFARIHGTYTHSAPDAAVFQTNPYLADTDGDALPDAWEALWLILSDVTQDPGLDPASPDAGLDASGTGITNLQKAAIQDGGRFLLDPLRPDSDGAGIDDATELSLGLLPLDPSDDASLVEGRTDQDGDGLTEGEEFEGRTSPLDIDTDRDGLLDARNVEHAATNPAVPLWQQQGIAHTLPSSGRVLFFGERGKNGNPTQRETASGGVPDGWLAYHGYDPSAPVSEATRSDYRHLRPSWWQESLHGPWWWGRPRLPIAGLSPTDLDGDGLDDRNGEDPTPGHHHLDAAPAPGVPTTRQAAQAQGECPGDPGRCRRGDVDANYDAPADTVPDREDRDATRILGFTVPAIVAKGVPLAVQGRLEWHDGRGGVGRVPIFVGLDGRDASRIVGAGFTDASGDFAFPLCICASLAVPRPVEAEGVPMLGVTTGPLLLSPPVGTPVGPHRLLVFSYNTTTTYFGAHEARDASHPQYYLKGANPIGARAAAVGPFEVRVEAGTNVTVTAALRHPVGAPLRVEARLLDAAGSPAAGRELSFRLRPIDRPAMLRVAVTGEQGSASVEFPTSGLPIGPVPIDVSFAGGQGLGASARSSTVVLRAIATIRAPELPRMEWDVGETIRISGRVEAAHTGPVRGTIVARLGTNAEVASLQEGGFSLAIGVPPGLSGPAELALLFAPGLEPFEPAEAAYALRIVRATSIHWAVQPTLWAQGGSAEASGALRGGDGAGQAGVPVMLVLPADGTVLGRNTTDGEGRFRIPIRVPSLPPGSHRVELRAEPSSTSRAAASSAFVLVGRATHLEALVAVVEDGVTLRGRLVDAAGAPMSGQLVELRLGPGSREARTDAEGRFAAAFERPPPGTRPFHVRFEGDPERGVAGADGAGELRLRALPSLRLVEKCLLRRGDSLQGEASATGVVARLPVTIAWPEGSRQLLTRPDGTFESPALLGSAVSPGRTLLSFTVGETPLTDALEVRLSICVTAETRVQYRGDPVLPRGGILRGSVLVRDEQGAPWSGREIVVHLPDGSRMRGTSGEAGWAFEWPVGRDFPTGDSAVRLEVLATPDFPPASLEVPLVVRDASRLELVEPPQDAREGEVVDLRIRLLDARGAPVPGEPIGVHVAGAQWPLIVRTDDRGEAVVPVRAGSDAVSFRYAGTEALSPADAAWQPRAPGAPLDGSLLRWMGLAALLVVAVAATWWALRRHARTHRVTHAGPTFDEAWQAAGPREASVLASYHRLVAVLGLRDLHPLPTQSVRDYLLAARDRFQLPPVETNLVARMVERVAYGGRPVTRLQASSVRESVRRLVATVERAERPGGRRP